MIPQAFTACEKSIFKFFVYKIFKYLLLFKTAEKNCFDLYVRLGV